MASSDNKVTPRDNSCRASTAADTVEKKSITAMKDANVGGVCAAGYCAGMNLWRHAFVAYCQDLANYAAPDFLRAGS